MVMCMNSQKWAENLRDNPVRNFPCQYLNNEYQRVFHFQEQKNKGFTG